MTADSAKMPPLCEKCRVPWAAGCSLSDCPKSAAPPSAPPSAEPPSGQGVTAEDVALGTAAIKGLWASHRDGCEPNEDGVYACGCPQQANALTRILSALTASPRVREEATPPVVRWQDDEAVKAAREALGLYAMDEMTPAAEIVADIDALCVAVASCTPPHREGTKND